jgi:hypothetical protein
LYSKIQTLFAFLGGDDDAWGFIDVETLGNLRIDRKVISA